MKHVVAFLCQVIGTALVVLFCMMLIFNRTEEKSIFQMAGQVAKAYEEQKTDFRNNIRLQKIMEMSAPEIRVIKSAFEVGEVIKLSQILQVRKNQQEGWVNLNQAEDVEVKLLSVADKRENIFYEPDGEKVLFEKSGSYLLKVQVTGDYGRCNVVDVTVLVNAG